VSTDLTVRRRRPGAALSDGVRGVLARAGLIPFLILLALLLFGSLESRYLSYQNLFNVFRQSSFLMIVSIGQMVVLLTAGLDLSVGSIIALVSVVTALTMSAATQHGPVIQMACGIMAGLATGVAVGALNGLGVAILRVNSFVMTLGMLSICFGLALTFSGGTPIYGLPPAFEDIFAYSSPLGIPSPVYFALGCVAAAYVYLTKTRPGRYTYAIGSNARAAELSGIRVWHYLTIVYIISGLLSAIAGILLTARVGTGESNMGQTMVLESISACVIGGVSLFGGVGRVVNVAMSALFISMLTNGMNLVGIQSYLQQVVLGVVLILAIVIEQLRLRYFGGKLS
jgi:ribose/xylose/arabinose/galactoside ABC-type transport system permease subunit